MYTWKKSILINFIQTLKYYTMLLLLVPVIIISVMDLWNLFVKEIVEVRSGIQFLYLMVWVSFLLVFLFSFPIKTILFSRSIVRCYQWYHYGSNIMDTRNSTCNWPYVWYFPRISSSLCKDFICCKYKWKYFDLFNPIKMMNKFNS